MRTELRILEARLFAATEPVSEAVLAQHLPEDADLPALLSELTQEYAGRGVNLARVAGKWSFRTAEDLAANLRIETKVGRKPSRAAVETLAIIAYHQPITRGEVEEIRGVASSRGSFDVLLEAGWIRPVGRRQTPGRPTTWGTSANFLAEFGLDQLSDLPGIDELKASGLLDTRPAASIIRGLPMSTDPEALSDEDDDEGEDSETGDFAEEIDDDFAEKINDDDFAKEDPDTITGPESLDDEGPNETDAREG